eukprot:CAMPEP_0201492232 /NCGR_PEP_ID=MMETSP0151_2-20130828/32318_1 /ASSEMBLY_ACC=CAM_ASM_000257 /TAXON_ID=200890 /ORGANISM="Paramoeba atlantica, Strain 621/1 / CCAP 1560/9" /LENGTH=275 /DNA_ID=CAMNT_0047878929 /DNA_START=11 /DNA_END=838 /DNA_ORIENTATION=+
MVAILTSVIVALLFVFVWLLYDGGYFWSAPTSRGDSRVSSDSSLRETPHRTGDSTRVRQVGSPNVGGGFRSNEIVEQLDPNAERHMHIHHIFDLRERKTLVLDLDETLVHSSLGPEGGVMAYDFTVQVPIRANLSPRTFYVFKRPYVDKFLRCVEEWYDVWIFTASLSSYADPVIDRLDQNGKLRKRLFREACLFRNTKYIKDLVRAGFDVSKTIIIDNSPDAYTHDHDNAIPIGHFYPSNVKDEELLSLLPILYCLRAVVDVRSVLSLHSLRSP